jgi:hypothetical protein
MKRPWDAIVWWEIRRIPYNLLLGLLGFFTVIVIELIGSHFVRSGEDVEEPLGVFLGVISYDMLANIFYTLGWISELLWSGGDTTRTEAMRRKVFRVGVIFSAILTLLPAALIPAGWIIFGFSHAPE